MMCFPLAFLWFKTPKWEFYSAEVLRKFQNIMDLHNTSSFEQYQVNQYIVYFVETFDSSCSTGNNLFANFIINKGKVAYIWPFQTQP